MRTVSREKVGTRKTTKTATRKITDQLCGRLILWDVGNSLEDIVIPATDYCHPRYNLSPQVELQPFSTPEERCRSVATAIKKASERLALIEATCGTVFGKKHLLH